MTSVEIAQTDQAAEYIGQIGSEDAAVGMDFVNDDIFQVFKELDPLGVMGKNAGMQHIGIGDHNMACLPDRFACSTGRIPVVRVGLDIRTGELNEIIEFIDLVRGKRLGREQIQRTCIRIAQNL